MAFKKGETPKGAKPFKKGVSGNPNGRPRKLPHLDTLLADVLGAEKDGITVAETILKRLSIMAINGNIRAAEVLLDRAHGKAKQAIDLDVKGDQNITITREVITRKV